MSANSRADIFAPFVLGGLQWRGSPAVADSGFCALGEQEVDDRHVTVRGREMQGGARVVVRPVAVDAGEGEDGLDGLQVALGRGVDETRDEVVFNEPVVECGVCLGISSDQIVTLEHVEAERLLN